MFVTTHAAIGALIGREFPGHPYLAFSLSVAAHFLSDLIPHGDTHIYKGYLAGFKVKRAIAYVTIDSIIAIFFSLWLLDSNFFPDKHSVIIGIAAGLLPDFLVAIYEVLKPSWLRWFHRLHFYFHNLVTEHRDVSFQTGFVIQMVFLGVLISRL